MCDPQQTGVCKQVQISQGAPQSLNRALEVEGPQLNCQVYRPASTLLCAGVEKIGASAEQFKVPPTG